MTPVEPRSVDHLGALLRDALVQFKTECALIETDRRRETGRWSYLDVKRAAEPLIRRLDALGVGPDERVAVVMSNRPRWLWGAYATFHRGGVLVPLDAKLTGEEQAALLEHARPRVLLTEYAAWRRLPAERVHAAVDHVLVANAPDGAELLGSERWEGIEADDPDAPEPPLAARRRDDPACIVYSSGTAGRPKGCVLSHDAYLEQAHGLMQLYPMHPGERYFSILPLNHAIDFMCGFLIPLACGATVVHQRTLRPEFLLETLQRQQPTHMAAVPMVLEAFERALDARLAERPPAARRLVEGLGAVNEALTRRRPVPGLSQRLLKPVHDAFGGRLRYVFCGGAPVDRRVAERFYRLGIPVVIGYGLTEAGTVATVNDLRPFRADSVGRAVPGVEVRIDRPGPDGVGEVCLRGRTLMQGYLGDPELTAETLRDGWLHTGDLGWLDAAHHLHLVGRAKNMVVTPGGKNVYPEDVEAALGALPCEELCVFATHYIWPDTRGEGDTLAVVVRVGDRADGNGDSDGPHALEAFLARLREANRRLPEHKRIGAVVPWDEAFPRTPAMKIKRPVLAERVREALAPDARVEVERPAA